MQMLILLAIILPIILGIVAFGIKDDKTRNTILGAGLIAQLVVAVMIIVNPTVEINVISFTNELVLSFKTDFIAKLFVVLISFIWLMASWYGFEYMKHEKHHQRFWMFNSFTLAALMALSMANNLFTMYLGYEMMTIMSFPLVLHTQTEDALKAGLKYFGYSVCGAGLGLLGIFFVSRYVTTTAFGFGGVLDLSLVQGNETLLYSLYLLMMIGFGGKAGMFPLHSWLPSAHPIAPSCASAVLSGLITKGGVLAIIRITYFVFGVDFLFGSFAQTVLLVLSIFAIFMGSMLAYKEKVLKKRLAYSTISQVSYVLFGIFVMTPVSLYGAILQVVYHALAKDALFLTAGSIIYKQGITRVEQLQGIGKKMPITMMVFVLASLSLIGIPPMGGFVSKWYIATGALGNTLGLVGVGVLMISALLTAGYTLNIVIDGFFVGKQKYKKNEVNATMYMPMILLVVALLVVSVFPDLIFWAQ